MTLKKAQIRYQGGNFMRSKKMSLQVNGMPQILDMDQIESFNQ